MADIFSSDGTVNMQMKVHGLRTALLAAIAMTPLVGPAQAQIKLPDSLTFTAYDTGTAGFNITVAVGKALKEKGGADLRVLPAGNDVARLSPLRAKRAQASAMGTGSFFGQEGVLEFAVKDWGPQRLQIFLTTIDCNGANLGVAKDTGVQQVKDLKGKRVGFVVGSPALNQNALAILAFGGLTQKDVQIVEFSSYGAMWKGIINNDVDAAFGTTITGPAKEVETSPRGLVWPPLPASDAAGWARLKKVTPYMAPHKTTCGAGISEASPIEMPTYPYPIYTVYDWQSADLVYAITKAMVTGYSLYKDAVPGATGLALDKQTMNWVLPVHAGAVRVFKEAGLWTAENEAHNAMLLKRQQVLADAWAAYLKSNPSSDATAFRTAWMAARKSALTGAGLDPIFD
jgi:TRAP transporter TAXI family solute receptor